MAGKRYSAGAIFLQVVPVFANVQRAIEDEAKNIDRALGDQMERSGEKAGQRAGKAAAEGIQKEVRKLDIGADLEKSMRDGVAGMDKALDGINTKNLGKKLRAELKDMKAELASIGDVDIKIDDNFEAVRGRVAALKSQIEDMRKRSKVFFDIKGLPEVYRGIASIQAGIDAIDSTIKMDVDTKPAERKLGVFEKAFKKTTKRAAESLSGNVSKEVRKIADELKYLENLRIGVDISGNRARAELKEISRDIERLQNDEIDIDAKVALAGAMADLAAFETALRKIDGEDVNVDINVKGDGLGKVARDGEDAANSFRSFNIVLLAATSAGPALVPVLAAIAGGLLALGPAAAVGAFGLGAVLAGFSGIGNALGALQSQQDATATNAQTNAKRMSGAADAIRSAQEALADAERAAGRAAEDAAERVADARRAAARAAEDSAERVADARESAAEAIKDALKAQRDAQDEYRDAVQDVKDAEEDLRQARADAQKDADTLARRQRQNAVDERQALLDLGEAQNEYNAVMADGSSTNTDKEQAGVNLEQAQIALNDTRFEQVALAEEAADYAANGVDGSDRVKTAQEQVTEALEAQKEAQDAVKEAAKEADKARVEGAEAVKEALQDQQETLSDGARAIRQALEDQAESASDSARNIDRAKEALARARQGQDDLNDSISSQEAAVNTAMDALGPAGRKFALYLFGLRDEWHAFRDDLQTAMLPSVQSALEGFFASPNASKSRDAMIALAGSFGDFVKALSTSFQGPAWGAFFDMLATTGPLIADAFGGAFIGLFEAFASILTVLAPYSLQFAEGLEKMMGAFADWAASEAGAAAITKFMDYAKSQGPAVIGAFVALAGALANLLVAMLPYSEGILEILTGLFNIIGDIANGPLGAFVGGLLAVITASQVAYGVMNLLLAGGALLGSAIGLLVFAMVGLALAVYYVYQQNETLGTILGVLGGIVLAAVAAFKIYWLWQKLVAAVQIGMAIATGASTAAITAQSTAAKIAYGITKAWTIVQAAFNAVMLGNPLAIVALLLIALVAAVIYAYKNHEGFRDLVIDVWEKIKTAFGVAWEFIKVVFAGIATAAMWLWENGIKPAFGYIKDIVVAVFGAIRDVWLNVLWPVIKTIGTTVLNLYKVYFKVAFILIKAAFKAMGIAFEWTWNNIIKPLWDRIKVGATAFWKEQLKPAFDGVKAAWDFMAEGLKKGWDKYGQPIFDWIVEKALPPLQTAFEDTIGVIGGLWDGLKKMIGTPIKFVIEKILNEGIIDSFNKIANWVGEDGFDHIEVPKWAAGYATGGILPGYTPGRDVHTFRSPTAGTLALSGGEAIMRPEWTAAMGPSYVDQMNRLARNGGVKAIRGAMAGLGGYWNGGVLPLLGGSVTSHGSSYPYPAFDLNYPGYSDYGKPIVAWRDGIAHPFDYGSDTSYGRGQTIDHGNSTSLYAHMSRVITSLAGQMVRAGQTIGYVGDYGNTGTPPTSHLHFEIRGAGSGIDTSDMVGSGGGEPQRAIPSWLMGIVKNPLGAFKGWVTDPLKNAAASMADTPIFNMITKVPALLGKKVVDKVWDVIPGFVKTAAGWAGGAADWAVGGVKNAAGAVGDAASDVAGGVKNGAGAVADFLGFADGGILPYNGTMMYDNGGYLAPGMTTVMNLTGKPEPVFTADQFDNLGVGGGDGFTYAPTINGSDLTAADLVDDLDFTRRKIRREGRYGRNK